MNRKIDWVPAYDKRAPEPHKNFGIHNMEMWWIVWDERGAVSICISTGWDLKSVREEMSFKSRPRASSLAYHSAKPRYDSEETDCDWLPGGRCYPNTTYLVDELFELLVEKGDGALWEELEKRFREEFKDE